MGIPRETRQALKDGTTDFERVLPGPDRMYPDTDLPLIPVEEERIARIEAALPEPPWEREAPLPGLGTAAGRDRGPRLLDAGEPVGPDRGGDGRPAFPRGITLVHDWKALAAGGGGGGGGPT